VPGVLLRYHAAQAEPSTVRLQERYGFDRVGAGVIMTFQRKRRIDYWVGGFLLALLFIPVRSLGILLRRDHTIRNRRGCAVIKLVGAGSLFLAMPSMLEIRERFPKGRFFLVGTPAVLKVAREFDWFDEYWVIDDSSLGRLVVSVLRVLWRMGTRTDHLIDLEVHSRFTTLLTVLSTVRNRIGFVDEIVFWRRGFYTHMTFFNVHGPVYVFYDLLARWFDVDSVSVSEFHKTFRDRVMAAKSATGYRPAVPYVAIGHGCSELGRERRLRPDEWRRMLRPMILAGHEILFLGGPEDRHAADAIIAVLGRGQNLCGQLSIVQSAKVIERAAAFYGIDSMLLHFARALAVPSVSVFGPTDPATRLRPLPIRERVAYARVPCSPCIHVNETPPCQGKRTCMALALEDLVTSADQEPVAERGRVTAPPVGWEVDPSASRVHEVSVTSY
jgi:ADP-heptose:LPS heptosyltransferase